MAGETTGVWGIAARYFTDKLREHGITAAQLEVAVRDPHTMSSVLTVLRATPVSADSAPTTPVAATEPVVHHGC